MTFDEIALQLAIEMMRRSGVREWEDSDTRTAISNAACEMAAFILNYGKPPHMSYINEGTTLKINGEADADYAWSMEGVANAAGRMSAVIDLGVAPRPYMYRWRCKCAFQATPTAGEKLRLYKSESDGTYEDGDVGVADAALAAAQLTNMKQFGAVTVDTADTSDQITGGVVEVHERYVSIGGWNASGATLNATDSNFYFSLTPIYDEAV